MFCSFFLKHNPLQEVLEEFFDMEQGLANEFAHGLSTILAQALELVQAMPARSDEDLQSLLTKLEIKELVHDGSEREVPRPQDSELPKANYRGKKKCHIVKNGFVASLIGLLLFVSPTFAGSVHDKRIVEEYSIPNGVPFWQDTGYQGYAPDGIKIIQPTKKPKGRDLTADEKSLNQNISSVRVRI